MSEELMPFETALGKIYGENQERYAKDMRRPIHDAMAQAYGGADSAARRADAAAENANQAATDANTAANSANVAVSSIDYFQDAIYAALANERRYLSSFPFELGDITLASGGVGTESTSVIRSTQYVEITAELVLSVPDGYKLTAYLYDRSSYSSYVGVYHSDGSIVKEKVSYRMIPFNKTHIGKYTKVTIEYDDGRQIEDVESVSTLLKISRSGVDYLSLTLSACVSPSNGTDYNTLTTPARYIVTSTAQAKTMINCPTVNVHTLIVMAINSVRRLQVVCIAGSGKIAIRVVDFDTSTTPTTYTPTPWLLGLTDADNVFRYESNSDLESCVSGLSTYTRYTSSDIPTDAPIQNSAFMTFLSGVSSAANGMQSYYPVNGNGMCVRFRTTSGWGDWYFANYERFIPMNESNLVEGVILQDGTYSTRSNGVSTQLMDGLKNKVIKIKALIESRFTVYEGNAPDLLNRSSRVSGRNEIKITKRYAAFIFYKWSNGASVPTTINDVARNIYLIISDTDYEPGYIHESPENEGVLNCIKRCHQLTDLVFTTKAAMPVQTYYEGNLIPANHQVSGVVYSSVREFQLHVPIDVSFETYVTAIANPNSYIYTRTSSANNSKTYYGTVCSSFVGYCYGIEDVIPTTNSFLDAEGFYQLPSDDIYQMKIGDALMYRAEGAGGHILIITDIAKKSGIIEYIETSEAAKPVMRRAQYTVEEFKNKYFVEGTYHIYRYAHIEDVTYTPDPYAPIFDEEGTNDVESMVIFPRRGNKANWPYGENIECDLVNYSGYTSYKVMNLDNNSTVKNGSVSSLITLTSMAKGRYKMVLVKNSIESFPAYFNVMNPTISYQAIGNSQVRVSFSDTMGDAASIAWCNNVQNDSDYLAVRRFYMLTDADKAVGYVVLTEPDSYSIDATNHRWLMRVNFKTEYGLYGSPLVEVAITQ